MGWFYFKLVSFQRKYAIQLREALTRLGPSFVKFGQALSIRPGKNLRYKKASAFLYTNPLLAVLLFSPNFLFDILDRYEVIIVIT